MSLAERLEDAAAALPAEADAIRPANGDPAALLQGLDRAGAARVLRWLLDHAPAEAGELAEDWLHEASGVAALEALDVEGLAKPGRKVLRRLLHHARSSGIEIADPGSKPSESRTDDSTRTSMRRARWRSSWKRRERSSNPYQASPCQPVHRRKSVDSM